MGIAVITPSSAIYITSNAKHSASCDSTVPFEFIFTFPCGSFDEVIYRCEEEERVP